MQKPQSKFPWLTRNIAALGIVSFFSDISSEMATAILPIFLVSIGGTAATLGIIEGVSDASISLMKIWAGWYSDAIGKRKPFATVGYILTAIGVGLFSVTFNWYQVLAARLVSWLGKGVREPARDALMVESTQPQYYGRMFGFHRMMDTLGAIIGPLMAFMLIKFMPLRSIFLIALIPRLC